jgi:hypothetical protein
MNKKYWNLFARELQNVLANYQYSMDVLEDLAGVSAEKTHALIHSLHTPDALPILTHEETRALERKLKLDTEERFQLRAGLLAASMQRAFIDYTGQDTALLLAEQALPTILQALQAQGQQVLQEQASTRRGAGEPMDDDEFEAFFEPLLDLLEEAEMALQLSYNVNAYATQAARALAARACFEQANADVEGAEKFLRQAQLWKDCREVSHRGLRAANERLEELGIS